MFLFFKLFFKINMANLWLALILISVNCLKLSQASDFCGVSDIDPESLTANGRKPTEQEWPWLAKIYINDKYICGGSIGNFYLFLFARQSINYFFIQFPKMW